MPSDSEANGGLSAFLSQTPDAVMEYAPDLTYRRLNAAAAALIGRPAEEVIGRGNGELFGVSAAEEIEPYVRRAFEIREPVAVQHRLPTSQGTRHFDTRYVPLLDADGSCRSVVGVCRDVTGFVAEQQAKSAALERSEARFRAVFNYSVLGIAVVGSDGRPVEVNPALEAILGRSEAQLKALRFDQFTHPEDVAKDEDYFREMIDGSRDSYQLEKRYLRPDGSLVYSRLSVSLMPADDQGLLFLAFVEDIGERKRLEEELRYYATHDPLTGLHNRLQGERVIEREAEQANRYGRSFAVAMLDIDHFKSVNDRHGHDAGDDLLVTISRALSGRLRKADALFRWGGEEFLVLISGVDGETAAGVAESLRATVAEISGPDGQAVTVSVGVTPYSGGESPKACVKRADRALYAAKDAGRNRVVLEPAPPA